MRQTWRWIYSPIEFMEDCRARYGDAFTLDLYGVGRFSLFCSPEAVKQIFTGDPTVLHAGEANELIATLVGRQSVLLLDEGAHMKQRRLLLPPFHGERMQAYATTMREATEASIDTWPLDTPFALHGPMQEITLTVILRAVFGLEEGAQKAELSELLAQLLDAAQSPFVLLPIFRRDIPGTPHRAYTRLRARADAMLYREIARRRAEPAALQAGRTDVLALLLSAKHDDGSPMTDTELRDELMTLLVAGHETTASTLAWAFTLLLEHPDAMRRARDELHRVVGEAPLALTHLPQLEYLDAVARETLRLRPILPIVGRRTTRPVDIGGFTVPGNEMVAACAYLAQHAEAAFPQAESFKPERWLGARTDPYAWLPFGGGVRRCIGMAFAMYEMKIVLATVLQRASLTSAVAAPTRVARRGITLVPDGGTRVVLRSRAPRALPVASA